MPKPKTELDIDNLIYLYVEKKRSLKSLEVIFGVTSPTLAARLRENGVKIRSAKEGQARTRAGYALTADEKEAKHQSPDIQIPDGTFEERVRYLRDNEDLRVDQIAALLKCPRIQVYWVIQGV